MSVLVAAVVLSWLCLVLLAFALSGLLRQVRDLQADLIDLGAQGAKPLAGRRVAELAGEPAVVLVVDPGCGICVPVLATFAELASTMPELRFVALSYRDSADWPELAPVQLRVDEHLYQQLDVPWAPALLTTGADGTIRSARPVDSPDDLRRQLSIVDDTTALSEVRS